VAKTARRPLALTTRPLRLLLLYPLAAALAVPVDPAPLLVALVLLRVALVVLLPVVLVAVRRRVVNLSPHKAAVAAVEPP
jgi:hypothetical protein